MVTAKQRKTKTQLFSPASKEAKDSKYFYNPSHSAEFVYSQRDRSICKSILNRVNQVEIVRGSDGCGVQLSG